MEEIKNAFSDVPEEVMDVTLPPPFLRDYYRDEAERIYWVDDEINDNLLDLVKMIIRCNKEDKGIPAEQRKPIKVFISSPGGEAQAMWSAMQAIQTSKTPCWTINLSYAYSAGAELLVAGHKRFALRGSTTMIHRGSCFIGGEQSVVESTQKHMKAMEQKYQDFLLSHTKIDPKVYKKKASADMFFDEYEALANGIVDFIVDDFDILF
jgi:ATP-dependent Clp protease protease subunit